MDYSFTTARPHFMKSKNLWRLDVCYKRVRRTFYSSKLNRREAFDELYKKAYRFYILDNSSPLVSAALEEYLRDYAATRRTTTVRNTESMLRKYLAPLLGRHMAELEKKDFQAVADQIAANCTTNSAIKAFVNILVAFCKWCASRDYLPDAAVPVYLRLEDKGAKREKKALTIEQLHTLFSAPLSEAWFLPAFRVLVLTGLRCGELCALLFERDYDGETVTVRENVDQYGGRSSGKTKNAARVVPLSKLAREQIQLHRDALRRLGFVRADALFCTRDGVEVNSRQLYRAWRQWAERHGIDLSLHELRHTHISYTAKRSTLELQELKKFYGHSEAMNTEAFYVHDLEKNEAERQEERARFARFAEDVDAIFQPEAVT